MPLGLPIYRSFISFGCYLWSWINSARIRTFALAKSACSCLWIINGSQNLFNRHRWLFSFFDPLQKRHLHFLACATGDRFVFGFYFLQSLLQQGLNILLTLKCLHGNGPIHSFPLLANLINLLKSSLACALVKPFLRRHILRALRRKSLSASGILKSYTVLVLLRCIPSARQIPAFILVQSWICWTYLSSYLLLLKLLLG